MDLATMGSLIGSVGFPIGLVLIIMFGINKGFKELCDKFFKPMIDRFFNSLDEVTDTNKVLVQTNASIMENVNIKIDDIEQKIDKKMEKLN